VIFCKLEFAFFSNFASLRTIFGEIVEYVKKRSIGHFLGYFDIGSSQ